MHALILQEQILRCMEIVMHLVQLQVVLLYIGSSNFKPKDFTWFAYLRIKNKNVIIDIMYAIFSIINE